MVQITNNFKDAIEQLDIARITTMINQNWELKKTISNKINTIEVEKLYDDAMKYGATGGKLLGAGGSGFLFLIADNFEKIEKNMVNNKVNLQFDLMGSKIIYNK